MKTVTYTQMRNDLSTILDLIRDGESVTVTQRGKPDLVITKGDVNLHEGVHRKTQVKTQEKNSALIEYMSKDTIETLAKLGEVMTNLKPTPEAMESIQKIANQFNDMLESDEAKAFCKKVIDARNEMVHSSRMELFKEALERTRTKHYKIIKSLEDK